MSNFQALFDLISMNGSALTEWKSISTLSVFLHSLGALYRSCISGHKANKQIQKCEYHVNQHYLGLDYFRSQVLWSATQSPRSISDLLCEAKVSDL